MAVLVRNHERESRLTAVVENILTGKYRLVVENILTGKYRLRMDDETA